MINYIQRKRVNYSSVEKYLNHSQYANHYTNNGPVKRLLEDKLSRFIDIPPGKRVLCASNGTTALHAFRFYYDQISGVPSNWISPSFTFPSCSVNNSKTFLVDIDPKTFTISTRSLQLFSGTIITNLFGTVMPFENESGMVIYDNASSFMSKDSSGKNISMMGDASFSSLHHTKTLGFGEGGFLVIDSHLYDEMQRILGFGFNDDREFKKLSSNFKMSDVSAAFILQHLDSYNIQRHLEIQQMFVDRLSGKPDYKLFNYSPGVFYGNLPILFKKDTGIKFFRDNGIEANKYYKPLERDHKNSWNLYNKIINFPLHEDLEESDVEKICQSIELYVSSN